MTEHCEFCDAPRKYRFFHGDYERFACEAHVAWVRRLLFLDRYRLVEPVPVTEGE